MPPLSALLDAYEVPTYPFNPQETFLLLAQDQKYVVARSEQLQLQ